MKASALLLLLVLAIVAYIGYGLENEREEIHLRHLQGLAEYPVQPQPQYSTQPEQPMNAVQPMYSQTQQRLLSVMDEGDVNTGGDNPNEQGGLRGACSIESWNMPGCRHLCNQNLRRCRINLTAIQIQKTPTLWSPFVTEVHCRTDAGSARRDMLASSHTEQCNVAKQLVEDRATNNRAEYMAALEAMKRANIEDPDGSRLLYIFSDSMLLIRSMTEWVGTWQKKNWVKSDGAPVQNRDLLELLMAEKGDRRIRWIHVKAHTGKSDWRSKWNDVADNAARKAAQSVGKD